jgi:hypothetical protein
VADEFYSVRALFGDPLIEAIGKANEGWLRRVLGDGRIFFPDGAASLPALLAFDSHRELFAF